MAKKEVKWLASNLKKLTKKDVENVKQQKIK